MQHGFAFKLSVLAASFLVTNALLGCGNVDPGTNMPQAGAGGSEASGGSDNTGGTPAVLPEGSLLPWVTGNTWTYRITNAGVVSEKTTTVGELQEVGGMGPHAALMAFHVVTAKGVDGTDRTESWQVPHPDNPDRIVRYREQAFGAVTGALEQEEHWDPEKLHIDGSPDRTVAGATWLERYDETKLPVGLAMSTHAVSERWTVLADDETLEVPAGVFENVIHLRKAGSAVTKEYWYQHGVGKLKETGSQTEELVDYTLEGQTP